MTPDEKEQWQRGREAAPVLQGCCAGCVSLGYLPVLLGGARLRQGRGFGLGCVAAVTAMLPCGPAVLAGFPVGIWALVVLNRPEIKDALRGRPDGRSRRERGDPASESYGDGD